MEKTYDQLQQAGYAGIITFWARIALLFLPLCFLIFGAYWAVITSEPIWIEIIGALLFTNVLGLCAACLCAFVTLLFAIYKPSAKKPGRTAQLANLFSLAGIILAGTLWSLSDDENCALYKGYVASYASYSKGTEQKIYQDFIIEYSTEEARAKYVDDRTIYPRETLSRFLFAWVVIFIIFHAASFIVQQNELDAQEEAEENEKDDEKSA